MTPGEFLLLRGDWTVLPDAVQRGEIDYAETNNLRIGAQVEDLEGYVHIGVWWTKHRFRRLLARFFSHYSGWEKPGSREGALLFTSNWNKPIVDQDSLIGTASVLETLVLVHVTYWAESIGLGPKDLLSMIHDAPTIVQDCLDGGDQAWAVPSLVAAGVYDTLR